MATSTRKFHKHLWNVDRRLNHCFPDQGHKLEIFTRKHFNAGCLCAGRRLANGCEGVSLGTEQGYFSQRSFPWELYPEGLRSMTCKMEKNKLFFSPTMALNESFHMETCFLEAVCRPTYMLHSSHVNLNSSDTKCSEFIQNGNWFTNNHRKMQGLNQKWVSSLVFSLFQSFLLFMSKESENTSKGLYFPLFSKENWSKIKRNRWTCKLFYVF